MDQDTIEDSRKLVAILFADIEGYTAMMESNEAAALQHLENFTSTGQLYFGRNR